MSARPEAAGTGSLIWVQGLACGAVLAFAPALGLVVVALFWPIAVALALDGAPGRPVARGVALCAAAASVGPVWSAWSGGFGLQASLALATDARVLAGTWCAAAGGWLLTALSPMVARVTLDAISATRAARLRAERARLRAAWKWDDQPADEAGSAGADL